MIGVGFSRMMCRMASNPPMPGISRSMMITSWAQALDLPLKPISALGAVSATLIPGSPCRASAMTLRASAGANFSSTRRVWVGRSK